MKKIPIDLTIKYPSNFGSKKQNREIIKGAIISSIAGNIIKQLDKNNLITIKFKSGEAKASCIICIDDKPEKLNPNKK